MNHATKVKHYYEQNTSRFLRFNRDATKSIHQPLWKEADFTQEEAYFYANELILEKIKNQAGNESLTILDLGCGVGSSVFYLQKKYSAIYYGVTISEAQIAIASQRAKQLSLLDQTQFIVADFTDLPNDIPKVDIAFSIEAFVHAPNAEAYFKQVSLKLKKGGKLILIDDFLNDTIDIERLDKKAQKAILDFKYGWLANSLHSTNELEQLAIKFGLRLIQETDLTPYMRNNTLKHKWIRFLVTAFRWVYELSPMKSYYFRSWIGGQAKQYCLKKGIVQYKKLVFKNGR